MKRYVWVLAGIGSMFLAGPVLAGASRANSDSAYERANRTEENSRPVPRDGTDGVGGYSWCVEVDGGLECGWSACGTTDEMSTCETWSTNQSSNEDPDED